MLLRSRIAKSVTLLAILVGTGIAGYILIEGWSLLDATYMTVITFTTVGYEEVRPLSTEGKIFSIFLMLGGVGVMLYILVAAVSDVVEGEFLRGFVRRRRLKSRLAGLNNHYILCGFGRVGQEVAEALRHEKAEFMVVDKSSQAIAEADEKGFLYVQGDATHDETLLSAGVKRARGLVAAAGNDSDNVFITLTAKGLNGELNIVARSTFPETESKLLRAGANRVISPYTMGGRRMALSVIRPLTLDVFDTVFDAADTSVRLAEVEVNETSPLAGETVGQCRSSRDVQILAIVKPTGKILVTPGSSTQVESGDALVLVGPDAQLKALEGTD